MPSHSCEKQLCVSILVTRLFVRSLRDELEIGNTTSSPVSICTSVLVKQVSWLAPSETSSQGLVKQVSIDDS